MQDLTVSLIQTELAWLDIEANLDMFNRHLAQLSPGTDLVVLPEMFSTGFSMEAAQYAETMEGKAVNWLQTVSRQKGLDITGSVMIRDDERYFNRLIWARPDGKLLTYDKNHLFTYAGEDKNYTPGRQHLTVELKGWRIRPFICYDLRFPIWCRNLGPAYDLALYVANWPKQRIAHWQALLRARAIENQAYVIGVNRVGTDGKGYRFSGESAVISPTGEVLFEKSEEACVHTQVLKYRPLLRYRAAFPAWKDADGHVAG
jgi:predicted amidohydrolase